MPAIEAAVVDEAEPADERTGLGLKATMGPEHAGAIFRDLAGDAAARAARCGRRIQIRDARDVVRLQLGR